MAVNPDASGPAWLHEVMSRQESEKLLLNKSNQNGDFFVRKRAADGDADEYVLVLRYGERPTHHLIKRNESGIWTINKKPFVNTTSLTELIEGLKKPVQGWPVLLQEGVPVSQGSANQKPASRLPAQEATTRRNEPAGASTEGGNAPNAQETEPPEIAQFKAKVKSLEAKLEAIKKQAAPACFFDRALTRDESAVLAADKPAGAYFVHRRKSGSDNEYVLVLMTGAKLTRHLITMEDDACKINGKPTGKFSTLSEVLQFLSKPQPANVWPVQLTMPIENPEAGASGTQRMEQALEEAKAELRAAQDKTAGRSQQQEQREREQLEREQRQREKEQREKEQREREQREREQREREQREREQREREQREREQRQREKEQYEREQREREQREQQEKQRQDQERQRQEQQQQQQQQQQHHQHEQQQQHQQQRHQQQRHQQQQQYQQEKPPSSIRAIELSNFGNSSTSVDTNGITMRMDSSTFRSPARQAWSPRQNQSQSQSPMQQQQGNQQHVDVIGRQGFANHINGTYEFQQGVVYFGRPVFKRTYTSGMGLTRPITKDLFLFYDASMQGWSIAGDIGGQPVIACVNDDVARPDEATSTWLVANRHEKFIMDEFVKAVPCNPMLSPFRRALRAGKEINFFQYRLSPREFNDLCAEVAHAHCRIERLKLYKNGLTNSSVTQLAQALRANTSITHLQLRENNLDDECADALADALRINKAIRLLSLRHNQITSHGAKWLAEAIRTNQTLVGLSLRDNLIDDQGAEMFADCLKVNTTLKGLAIYDNRVKPGTARKLKKRVAKYSSCSFETRPAVF